MLISKSRVKHINYICISVYPSRLNKNYKLLLQYCQYEQNIISLISKYIFCKGYHFSIFPTVV